MGPALRTRSSARRRVLRRLRRCARRAPPDAPPGPRTGGSANRAPGRAGRNRRSGSTAGFRRARPRRNPAVDPDRRFRPARPGARFADPPVRGPGGASGGARRAHRRSRRSTRRRADERVRRAGPVLDPGDGRADPRPPEPHRDLTDLYSARLRAVAHEVDPTLPEGVYAQFRGPHYETPAEIAMAGVMGADLVGMSTALEA